MKTNQELLDFYGVELGKKYKITGQSVERILNWVGRTFWVKKRENGELVIQLSVTEAEYSIHVLDDYVYEEAKELLTDEERDYLKTVIKPFRDRIQRIYKSEAGNFYEGGEVLFFDLKANDYFYLPELPLNKMFSGMEQYKKYTLEELGL